MTATLTDNHEDRCVSITAALYELLQDGMARDRDELCAAVGSMLDRPCNWATVSAKWRDLKEPRFPVITEFQPMHCFAEAKWLRHRECAGNGRWLYWLTRIERKGQGEFDL